MQNWLRILIALFVLLAPTQAMETYQFSTHTQCEKPFLQICQTLYEFGSLKKYSITRDKEEKITYIEAQGPEYATDFLSIIDAKQTLDGTRVTKRFAIDTGKAKTFESFISNIMRVHVLESSHAKLLPYHYEKQNCPGAWESEPYKVELQITAHEFLVDMVELICDQAAGFSERTFTIEKTNVKAFLALLDEYTTEDLVYITQFEQDKTPQITLKSNVAIYKELVTLAQKKSKDWQTLTIQTTMANRKVMISAVKALKNDQEIRKLKIKKKIPETITCEVTWYLADQIAELEEYGQAREFEIKVNTRQLIQMDQQLTRLKKVHEIAEYALVNTSSGVEYQITCVSEDTAAWILEMKTTGKYSVTDNIVFTDASRKKVIAMLKAFYKTKCIEKPKKISNHCYQITGARYAINRVKKAIQ